MKDCISELWDALNDQAGAGLALEDVADHVYTTFDDVRIHDGFAFPALFLDPKLSTVLDIAQGSGHVLHEGRIDLLFCVALSRVDTLDAYNAAQEAAEDLRAAGERVLRGLRAVTSADHATGVWHWMTWAAGAGQAMQLDGAGRLSGIPFYCAPISCVLKFRRYRASA